MATQPKVFIASSSEGLKAAKAVRALLLEELEDTTKVNLWTRAFALSATYIESLEQVCSETDFAVLVLTPDDVTTSRETEKLAPRDNVIFELGLFIGSLGRKRCFIVNEQHKELKLPTDLLGVKTAKFKKPEDGDLKEALVHPVLMISERISEMGSRPKLSAQALAELATIRRFYDSISGAWWERITVAGVRWLSFFQIDYDDVYDALHFRGRLYDKEGALKAHWKSVIVRILKDENKILYHWQGWYPSSPDERFHGFGEMEFQKPTEMQGTITRGYGKYWDVDEAHPEKTAAKSVQLRRIFEKSVKSTITAGSEKEIKALIIRTLEEW